MTRVFRLASETGGLRCQAEIFFVKTLLEFMAKFCSSSKEVRSRFNAAFYVPVVC